MKIKNKKTGKIIEIPEYLIEDVKLVIQQGGDPMSVLETEGIPTAKDGIHIKPENKGKFNATKKRTGKTTEELTHSKNPLTRKRAIFAQNARKWKHENGGYMQYMDGESGANLVLNPNLMQQNFWDVNSQFQAPNTYNVEMPEYQYLQNPQITPKAPEVYPNSTQKEKPKFQSNLYYFKNSTPGIAQNLQRIGSGASKMAQGDWKGAISDWGGTEFELAKGVGNLVAAQRNNKRIQGQITNEFRDAQLLPYLNDYSDTQYGNPNIMMENGGISKYKAHGGLTNVEVENLETIKTPEGLVDRVYGNTHSEGGIPMNLPIGSKVLSEKLKHPEMKKSFAKLGKKFETKKDIENLDSPISDNINKQTAELNISLKNRAIDDIFQEQESLKLQGAFGKKVQNETKKDYEMKYGGMTKAQWGKYVDETFSGINPNIDWKTLRLQDSEKQRRNKFLPYEQNELPTNYGNQLGLESVFNDFEINYGVKLPQGTNEQKLQALREYQSKLTPELTKDYKLNFARGNKELYNQFVKSKGYKKSSNRELESQNFYDWAKTSGKITDDYANKGLWGHEYYNTSPLNFNSQEEYEKWKQDPDWKKVGKYYVDRSADPTQPITYYNVKNPSKLKTKEKPIGSTPTKLNPLGEVETSGKKGLSNAIPVMQPFNEPYLESPVARFKFNPNLVDFRKQSPDFTEIDRQFQLSKTGDPRVDANLFAKTLNAKNQLTSNVFNANQQGQFNVDQTNAQILNNTQAQQYGENAQFRDLVGRMRGAIGTQKLLDRNVSQANAQKQMDYYNFTLPTIENLYGVDEAANPYKSTKSKLDQYVKYGGKIKPKIKKKSPK